MCVGLFVSVWLLPAAETEWSVLRAPAEKALQRLPPDAVAGVLQSFEAEMKAKGEGVRNPTGLLIHKVRSRVWVAPEAASQFGE